MGTNFLWQAIGRRGDYALWQALERLTPKARVEPLTKGLEQTLSFSSSDVEEAQAETVRRSVRYCIAAIKDAETDPTQIFQALCKVRRLLTAQTHRVYADAKVSLIKAIADLWTHKDTKEHLLEPLLQLLYQESRWLGEGRTYLLTYLEEPLGRAVDIKRLEQSIRLAGRMSQPLQHTAFLETLIGILVRRELNSSHASYDNLIGKLVSPD